MCHSENEDFYINWGIDIQMNHRGGIDTPHPFPANRKIYLLQRKKERLGKRLGKTTGWIHRQSLKKKGVETIAGVTYNKIDDQGLHITIDEQDSILKVDNIVICAGQTSNNSLAISAKELGLVTHVIGGAYEARELDARFAIEQAVTLANKI